MHSHTCGEDSRQVVGGEKDEPGHQSCGVYNFRQTAEAPANDATGTLQ